MNALSNLFNAYLPHRACIIAAGSTRSKLWTIQTLHPFETQLNIPDPNAVASMQWVRPVRWQWYAVEGCAVDTSKISQDILIATTLYNRMPPRSMTSIVFS
jgi:hypothetical protein